ncbi:hypothetical protein [uncultured Rhodoferax sp.]|uniref:hypothetical protein n=1 Tax=uncultured Rhodoferax sp. TaxID=223188 RepID=UPI0025CCDC2B|nr:hypothetical protein [uncultured Rhodoferax sp.]
MINQIDRVSFGSFQGLDWKKTVRDSGKNFKAFQRKRQFLPSTLFVNWTRFYCAPIPSGAILFPGLARPTSD